METYVEKLLGYLGALAQLQRSGHIVNSEIKEAIKEVREELGLIEGQRVSYKESMRLLFEVKLGHKPTFFQGCLFEATFGDYWDDERVKYNPNETTEKEIENAIKVLKELSKGNVEFITSPHEVAVLKGVALF